MTHKFLQGSIRQENAAFLHALAAVSGNKFVGLYLSQQ